MFSVHIEKCLFTEQFEFRKTEIGSPEDIISFIKVGKLWPFQNFEV